MRASQTRNLLHVSLGRRLALRNAELYPPTIYDLGEAGGRAVLQDITSIVSEQGLAAAVGAAACAVVAVLAAMWATRRLRGEIWSLETSLNNMSQGLTMFGPDGRLVRATAAISRCMGSPPRSSNPDARSGN